MKLSCPHRPPWEPIIAGEIACVPLLNGGFAVVDLADLPIVRPFDWLSNRGPHTWYAITAGEQDILMHRMILAAEPAQMVDHRLLNGLDNRRSNLRAATKSQNGQNASRTVLPQSGFKGVYLHRQSGRWQGRIHIERKAVSLGYYPRPQDAAVAYDAAALKHYGDFALTNHMLGLL